MIAVYARADHPKGYGFGDGRAHGYVVLFVRCKSRKEVEAVSKRLSQWNNPFLGPQVEPYYSNGRLGEWYGGLFELLAVLPGNKIDHLGYGMFPHGRFASRGDNRFTGVYEAEEVLSN